MSFLNVPIELNHGNLYLLEFGSMRFTSNAILEKLRTFRSLMLFCCTRSLNAELAHLTLKALGGVFHPPPPPVRFLADKTSEVESFSTRNFVTFPNIKCRIRTK